jgi:hypothetical protein
VSEQTRAEASPVELPTSRARGTSGFARVLDRDTVGLALLWIVLGTVLAEFAIRIGDFIDFDAGRYERLAISIARTGSIVPRVNGVNIHSWSQLYPILIAPFFVTGYIPDDLKNASLASGFIMSSACIPVFLLTRRVTRARWAAYVVAALTVCMPWIVTSLFLMTEAAAYPAATWALFAMVVTLASPSKRHDVLAIVALAAAYFARGELIGLVFVLPLALVAYELGRAPAGGVWARISGAGRSFLRGHVVLVAVYLGGALVALALYAAGRLSSVIGIYGAYSDSAHLAWGKLPRALVEHLATFSLGVGVVPLVIALAWSWANAVRPAASAAVHAFACVASVTSVALFVQATNFDVVVNGYIHDRFLMYFVPVVLVGTVLALVDARPPRWSLLLPLALVVAGFVFGEIPFVTWGEFVWLDLDTPISTVYRVMAENLGGLTVARVVLVCLAVGGTALFVLGARKIRPGHLAAAVLGFCAVAMLFATAAVFQRTFGSLDRNGRMVTTSNAGSLDWIDRAVGPGASVTAIPYPISSDWFVSEQRWVDFEFFNKSIQRSARIAGLDPFDYVGFWFPKLDLHIDPKTGSLGTSSPTRWIVESDKETRFAIAGQAKLAAEDAILVEAARPWKLAWLSSGLYDDGWTQPGVPVRLRVYSRVGQRHPELRTMSMVLRNNGGPAALPVALSAGGKTVHTSIGAGDVTKDIQVCVPPRGYADATVSVRGSQPIPGDLGTYNSSQQERRGGIFFASLAEANEIGGRC